MVELARATSCVRFAPELVSSRNASRERAYWISRNFERRHLFGRSEGTNLRLDLLRGFEVRSSLDYVHRTRLLFDLVSLAGRDADSGELGSSEFQAVIEYVESCAGIDEIEAALGAEEAAAVAFGSHVSQHWDCDWLDGSDGLSVLFAAQQWRALHEVSSGVEAVRSLSEACVGSDWAELWRLAEAPAPNARVTAPWIELGYGSRVRSRVAIHDVAGLVLRACAVRTAILNASSTDEIQHIELPYIGECDVTWREVERSSIVRPSRGSGRIPADLGNAGVYRVH